MKKEDVLKKYWVKEISLKGMAFDNGQIVVPMNYHFVSRAKLNLFIGTYGSVNGFRTYGVETDLPENGRPYGEYFNECLQNKTLDTEVHFYTIDGQIPMQEKILACIACLNDDMIILLKEDYTWSIAIIDYEKMTITDIAIYSGLDYLKQDYTNRRFVIRSNDRYSLVSFNSESEVIKHIQLYTQEPVKFNDYGMIVKENNKYGFIKYDGEVILICSWEMIRLHKDFIEASKDGRTAIYLYNGYMSWYEEIRSFETLYVKGILLFKVQMKNGYYNLYSTSKALLPKEVDYLEILSDGTAIICLPLGGCALIKYDITSDSIVPILPTNCFDYKAKLFSNMSFVYRKDDVTVEIMNGNKVATYDTNGNQLTRFKYRV